MRRNVPKVVVAITDGRSQDEVKKSAAKLQHAGKELTARLGPGTHSSIQIRYRCSSSLPLFRLQRLRHRCCRRGFRRAAGDQQ